MRFLLSDLRHPQYRTIVGVVAVPAVLAPAVVLVGCPHCGIGYVADVRLGEELWDVAACESNATVRLGLECPDHPHWFVVEL